MTPAEILAQQATPQDLATLSEAFERFAESAQALEAQQAALHERIRSLDIELAEANDELAASLCTQSDLANGLHNVLENLTAGVVAVDAQGIVTTINTRALDLLALEERGAVVGAPLVQTVGLRLDSAVLSSLVHFQWQPERSFEITLGSGGEARHLRVLGSPARDVETGELRGGILVIEDVSALVRWRERALLNERLSTMGQVAAQIAHEIRNPLGSVELLASALAKDLEGGEGRAHGLAEHIVGSVRTLDSLVSNILLFARGREPDVAPVGWGDVAQAAVRQSQHALMQAQVTVEWRGDDSTPAVLGDAELLVQAIANLLINASQALAGQPAPRRVVLETGHSHSGAWIRVSDNGPGVPDVERARIFDPFVTTKRRGTGLGLAIVAHIVEAHGGRARCGEGDEGGAAFEITLPRADAAANEREGTHG